MKKTGNQQVSRPERLKISAWRVITFMLSFMMVFTMMPCLAPVSNQVNAASKLQWPVPGHEVNPERHFFYNNDSDFHQGIDISQGKINGKKIYAAQAGTVIRKDTCSHNTYPNCPDCCGGGGTRLIIRGTDGYTYEYAHMQAGSIPTRIKAGKNATSIKKGQYIGKVGSTGNSTGPHLHFGVFNGEKINYKKLDNGNWIATNAVNPESFSYNYDFPCKSHNWDTKTGLCNNCVEEYRENDSVNDTDKTKFFNKLYRVKTDVNNAYVLWYPNASANKVTKSVLDNGRYIYVYGSVTVGSTKWYKVKYGVGKNTIGYVQASKIGPLTLDPQNSDITITGGGNMDLKKGSSRKLKGEVSSKYVIRDIKVYIDNMSVEKAAFVTSDVKKSYYFSADTDLDKKLAPTLKKLSAGTHNYKIVARDASGKRATYEAAYYVNNDVYMPLISYKAVVGGYKVTIKNRTANQAGELWERLGGSRDFEKKSSGYSATLTTAGTRTISAYTVLNGKKSGVAKKKLTIKQLAAPKFNISQKNDGTATVTINAAKGASISYKIGDDGTYTSAKSNPVTVSVDGGKKLIAYAEGKGYVRSETKEYMPELITPDVPVIEASNLIKNKIGTKQQLSLFWSKDAKASSYTVRLYNSEDKVVKTTETDKSCASITIPTAGEYYVTVYASNEIGTSDDSKPLTVIAVDPLKVTFRDAARTEGDTEITGAILNQQKVDYGKTPTAVTAPVKEGYVFQGWDNGTSTSTNGYLRTVVYEDVTYTAVYAKKDYIVKLIDTTGSSLGSISVSHGESLLDAISEAGIRPTVSSGSRLIGWQVTKTTNGESKADIEHVDSDMEVHAVAAWENDDLPVIIDNVTADQTSDGNYVNVKVDITANNSEDLSFYMVVALKAEDATTGAEKTVYADRKIVYLSEEDGQSAVSRQVGMKLPMKSGASKTEVSVLECTPDMNTGGLYAESKSAVINLSYDWDDDSWSDYSAEKPEESDTRQIESKTTYEYRQKEVVYSSAESLSGYTKVGAEYYNFTTGKWQTSPYTKVGDYAVSEPVKTTKVYDEYTDTLSYNSIVSYWSYANLCPHMNWYSKTNGASCPNGGKAYTMLKVYSSKSLAASGYTKNSNDSYTLPKTISTSNPGNLGTIYRIDLYNNNTGEEQARVNTFTTKSSDNHIKLWDRGTRTLYRATTVRMRNKFEKWGDWQDAPDNITESDTVDVREKGTVYRYRDAIPATASPVDIDPEGKVTRHLTGTITDADNNEIEMNLEDRKASVMVYRSNNTDPNKYQLEYLGNTVIGAGNTYDITFIPKDEPTLDTGNFIVALSIEGMSGIINIAVVDVDDESIPSYDVIFGCEEKDNNGIPVFTEIEGSRQSVKRHGDADLSLVEAPEKEGYYFVGWEGRTTNIIKDVKVTAKYIAVPNAVAIIDWVRNDIDIFTANTGDVIELPGVPEETNGYTFAGWKTPEGDILDAGAEYTIAGTTVIEAEYTQQEYTVTFIGVDGSVVDTQSVKYGEAAEPPAYTWSDESGEFAGWSQENSWWNVDSDMEVQPLILYNNYAPDPSAISIVDEESSERKVILQVDDEEDLQNLKIYYSTDESALTEEEIARAQAGISERVKEYTEPLTFEGEREIYAVSSADNANISNVITATYAPYTEDEPDGEAENGWGAIGTYDVKAKAGNDVTVTVELTENPGLNAYSLMFVADKDIFVPDLNEYDEPVVVSGEIAGSGTQYTGETDEGWTASWVSEDTMTQTGKLLSMTFHVDEEAEEGTYPITLYYGEANTLDEMGDTVDLTGAKVTIDSEACIGLDTLDVRLARYSYEYEGSAIEPAVSIDGLKEGDDYTVVYENNVDVGTAKAIITGFGDYAGTVEKEFTITQANIANADLSSIEAQIKTGSAIEPDVALTYNGNELAKNTDYEVEYSNNTEVGTATVTVKGIGNFRGTKDANFEIIESIENQLEEAIRAKEEAEQRLAETEQALTAAQTEATNALAAADEAQAALEQAEEELAALQASSEATEAELAQAQENLSQAQRDAETAQQALTDAQTALAAAEERATEAEERAAAAEQAIADMQAGKSNISEIVFELVKTAAWKGGNEVCPYDSKLQPKGDLNALRMNVDYTVTYKDNTEVGTATAVIKGKGDYCGTVKTEFTIVPYDLSADITEGKKVRLSASKYTYNGKNIRPKFVVNISKPAKASVSDYKVTYPSASKNVGTYTAKISFKGNFAGTGNFKYTVLPKGTTLGKLTAAKKGFTVKWKKQAAQTTGYEVQYSLKSNFKNAKKVIVKKNKTISQKVTKLKAKKKYYVRIRTFKTAKGKKYYSSWSKAKTVKTR